MDTILYHRNRPLKDIAQQEGVTINAVKSWGRQVNLKLKDEAEYLAMPNK
ncbi:hypothetical protein ACFQ3N_02330 [Virgibacillus byunsanensis]|uniref:Uncharacterized protein n=1 Tax=Virgibacillus byunsanensis TaxID=570945 RepID=A0ABW3LFV0_9BACI